MRLVIVDDHFAVAEALSLALAPAHEVIEILGNGETLVRWLARHTVDAILLDTTLPHCNVQELIRQVRTGYPTTIVIAISIHDDHGDWPGLHRFGAHGVVSKTRPLFDLRFTLDMLATKAIPFQDDEQDSLHPAPTSRQFDVLVGIAGDQLHKEIAAGLNMSEPRVDEHVAELKKRLDVNTSAGIALRAVDEGWIEPRVAPRRRPDPKSHRHGKLAS